MSGNSSGSDAVTRLLDQARSGDPTAYDRLLPLLYSELHSIAERHMRSERGDHTLQPTALVHEAYVRLVGGAPGSFTSRTHFLRTAAQAMRRVLVDHARARSAAKRGGALRVTLDERMAAVDAQVMDVLIVDEALARLAQAEPRWAQVVELRWFAGLEVPEVAEALGISTATVKRDWRFARAWLARALDASPPPTVAEHD